MISYDNLYKLILKEQEQVYSRLDSEMLNQFTELIINHERIFTIGVGREGLATRAFTMRLVHLGKEAHWIWDDTTPNIGRGDLLIGTLGDGEIGHLNYVCEQAKNRGAHVCVVTGSPSGKTAATVADSVFFIPASVYRGVDNVVNSQQPMGNLFEQCLFVIFDIVIILIVDRVDEIDFTKMSKRHRNIE